MKFHHLGIFVKNLDFGEKELRHLVNIKKSTKIIKDKNLGIKVKFFYTEKNLCYELVAPYGENNPVSKVLESKKNTLNHIAFKTKNFNKKILEYRKLGYAPLQPALPAKAFGNKKVIFFLNHINLIIEIIEN